MFSLCSMTVANEFFTFFIAQSKVYFNSGMRFTPNESGHVLAFIFGTFFLVTLVMTVIYIIYYDDRHIPRLMAMIRSRHFLHTDHSNVIFARFHGNDETTANLTAVAANDDDNDETVEVDLNFGTDQSIENVNRAFNNPMFDANIGRREGGSGGDDENGIREAEL